MSLNARMLRLIVLGASGSLGRHVLRQALAAGPGVTAFVRTPSKLPPRGTGAGFSSNGGFCFLRDAVQSLTVQKLRPGSPDELIQNARVAESREAAGVDAA